MSKKFFIINIVLNICFIIMGIVLFNNPAFGLYNAGTYFSVYFFVVTFISILAYFLYRSKDNEENLILAVSSVITGSYLFLCGEKATNGMLAMGIIIFIVLFLSYKCFVIFKYKDTNSYKWFLELINTLCIFIIGLLTVANLLTNISVYTLIFGYFLIALGTVDLLEMLLYIFLKSSYLKKVFKKIYIEEKKEDIKDLFNK